jgi:hypothetical protein
VQQGSVTFLPATQGPPRQQTPPQQQQQQEPSSTTRPVEHKVLELEALLRQAQDMYRNGRLNELGELLTHNLTTAHPPDSNNSGSGGAPTTVRGSSARR